MNKKAILMLTTILIIAGTGTTFVGCKDTKGSGADTTTSSTDDEKVDIIFDAEKLENSTKEDVDKLLNQTGNIPDEYKNTPWDSYYFEYENQETLYVGKDLKCISLSLSSGIYDKKIEIFDVQMCLKEYGLDIEDALYKDNPNNRKYYDIKDFEGEVSVFFNSDSIINKIVFYPKGEKAETDLKDEIVKEIEVKANNDSSDVSNNKDTGKSNNSNKNNTSNNSNNSSKNNTTNKEDKSTNKANDDNNNTSKEDKSNKNDTSKNDIKSLSDSERQNYLINLVKNNDKNYIAQQENNVKGTYKFSVDNFYTSDSDIITSINSSWGIEKEDYYDVCGSLTNEPKEDQVEGELIRYLVGVKSGRIIMIPFQGGMDAYQIKNNTVVTRYQYRDGNSYKWR